MKERGGSAAAAGQCARRRSDSSVPCGLLQGAPRLLSSGGTLQQKGGSLQWKKVERGSLQRKPEVCNGTGSLQRKCKPEGGLSSGHIIRARPRGVGGAQAWLMSSRPACRTRWHRRNRTRTAAGTFTLQQSLPAQSEDFCSQIRFARAGARFTRAKGRFIHA